MNNSQNRGVAAAAVIADTLPHPLNRKVQLMFTKMALIAGILSVAGLTACDDTSSRSTSGTSPPPPPPSATQPARPVTPPAPPAADNTGANKRDAGGETKTPMDQSNSKADIDITAAIRKAVMDDKMMSTNAQNCKIITEKGVVTLRGVVDSQAEKDAIEAKAKIVTGVSRVDNQLEVKKPS